MFISFEGGEGSGKSTHIRLLAQALQQKGHELIVTREPGGTSIGTVIRNILLTRELPPIDSKAELLLYAADRAQHVSELISRALKTNKIVLCDRYTDATIAYQGYGRKLDLSLIEQLNAVATGGLQPDLTLLLDCPAEVGLRRSQARLQKERSSEDRFERETLEFHQRVREGYLKCAAAHPERFRTIDAARDIDAVQNEILQEVEAWIKNHRLS